MDFYFEKDRALDLGAPSRKFEGNLRALRLMKELIACGRAASDEEQAVLARYVGWGDSALLRQLTGSQELKNLLSDDEMRSARSSSLNAHYTALPVIGAMWTALDVMGFGARPFRALDPSSGVGHFKSLTPVAMRGKAEWVEIELDHLTAQILGLLHPESKLFAEGFERVNLPENWFDLVISNVPFGDYGVANQRVPGFLSKSIHDFFFANTVRLLKPGGILAYITSRYTLDKKDSSVRSWLARHLDLLAAVRLPNTAFKSNAGTEVVTDVIVMRKRENENKETPLWVETGAFTRDNRSANVNRYFLEHPEMVIGIPSMNGTMYRSDGYTVESNGRDLKSEMLDALYATLPMLEWNDAPVEGAKPLPSAEQVSLVEDDPRVVGLKAIYLAAKELIALETTGKGDPSELRLELNRAYDTFASRYGPINNPRNIRLLKNRPEAPFLQALEWYEAKSNTATKTGIFSESTVHGLAKHDVTCVDDALLVCLDREGQIDLPYIASLANATEEDVREQLVNAERVYQLPGGGWAMQDEYLSGNVREKLLAAKAAAELDPRFRINVAALESAIPLDLQPGQIRASLGAGWIPTDVIADFIRAILEGGSYKVTYIPHLAHWEIDASYLYQVSDSVARSRWGTACVHALDLIDAGLNARTVTVYDRVMDGDDEKRVVNQTETVAAQAKLQDIKAEFERWLWSDPERTGRLVKIYNERYNAYRVRQYAGSHLSTPGLNKIFDLRENQRNAAWRILQSQSTFIGHEVGMGKTLTAIVAAMEAKRLGLARKAMIVTPNHITSQWEAAVRLSYPGAKLLAPAPADLAKARRGQFLSRVATNDWDIIIVPFSSFKLLPVSADTLEGFYQAEIDRLEEYLWELKADTPNSRAVKEIEKSIKRFRVKIENLASYKQDHKGTITWEELGVDMLFVDEFHGFKNLFFATRMTRIAGLTNSDSQRAFDMFVKMRWLQRNGGKTIGLTGTPVTNTLAEMFTMQRYFQMETLEELGLSHFDAWANQFALAEPGLEMTPDGSGFRMNTRFRKFVNVPELMQIFLQVADMKRIEADNHEIVRPDLYKGKPIKVLSNKSEQLVAFVENLAARAEKVRSGLVDPRDDNMLCITGDGRKAALDMSLVEPTLPGAPMPKIDALADVVAEIYRATTPALGTQIIFCDLATPKAKA